VGRQAVDVLGVGGRRVDHRLFVLRPVGGQVERPAELLERLPEAGDVAVAEDRPHAAGIARRRSPSRSLCWAAR
jgi:hypothetical protein